MSQVTSKVNLDLSDSFFIFLYLVFTIVFNKSDWAELYQHLSMEKRRWGMVSGVLVNVGATVRARETLYKAAAQEVLLYGS